MEYAVEDMDVAEDVDVHSEEDGFMDGLNPETRLDDDK